MSMLDELLAASRGRARRDARRTSLVELRRLARRMPHARHFEAALRYGDRLGLVAEIKRASPSAGRFAAVGTGTKAVAELAGAYGAAGARCLSVLTEPTRFGGSDDDLAAAAAAGLPVLRKDFTVTPYQVWQTRALGADALLLIARALPGGALAELLEVAGEAGLDALVEVHDEADLQRALRADATLIGVNARDLATQAVDVDAALRLLETVRDAGATLVAESGLASAADLQRAAAAGAHGVLVGTALLAGGDPAAATAGLTSAAPRLQASLRPPPVPARAAVKVCGQRTSAGVRAAVRAGADLAGFVVTPGRRRAVTAERAGELAGELNGGPQPVLVFHAPTRGDVSAAVEASGIRSVQLAGFDAPPEWPASYSAGLHEVIGVLHAPATARAALTAAEGWHRAGATRVLIEGADAATGGGAGVKVSLAIVRRLNRILPVGVAGGLTPGNVAAVVAAARPAYVDASSGLERNGTSDPARIAAFVRNARRDPTGADRVDRRGRFGRFGGRYVPETLLPALVELEEAWRAARSDRSFTHERDRLASQFIGRPTPIFEVPERALGAKRSVRVFLKREDLAHTGAHKINNALGQALLAQRIGKRRVIAETGAGQHGVATATACALLGLDCIVYMGTTDIERQAPNVRRMSLLGAEVRPVATGNGTLRDALNEALRDWVGNVETTFYILGSAAGPHPYPEMVASLQSVIGREARAQMLALTGRLPDLLLACVGGGSNAIGLFRPFLDTGARLIGVEAGGKGDALGDNAASLGLGRPGVLHGALTMVTQTDDGQVVEPHSVSAGLDYPGVGPQLAALAASGRLEVQRSTDAEALEALSWLSRACGIVPALEPAHAVAAALRLLPDLAPGSHLLVNLSGRGDKDLDIVARELPAAMAAVVS
ncbi:MAG: tryptophan synthase subunit beta [Chloroflexota bacterium]